MKHFFIVNTASGRKGTHAALVEKINNFCRDNKLDWEIRFTEYRAHAKLIAKSELEKARGPIRFYACGGDGTVNEVASALVGSEVGELAVIPVGTGNDFVRSFSPDGSFLSLEDQLSGEVVRVDAVSAGESIFVNMLNVGFDSAVVSTISHLRDKCPLMRGKLAYIIGVVINLFKMPKTALVCEFDNGERVEGTFLLSAFSNGKYYGGGFKAASQAELDDGILDVILVSPCSRFVFLSLVSKYKNGTLLQDKRSEKYLTYRKCRSVKVKFSPDSDVCVDGEIVDEHEFDIKMLESSLKFCVPCQRKVVYENN